MVGQGVLRECVRDAAVGDVLCVGRSALPVIGGKVQELVCRDLFDLTAVEEQLVGFDACFFCLGVSSAGMSEPDYRRLTYDLTLSIARTLVRLNPEMVFEYVSGASTDSTEKGRTMWARVKGQTENALLGLGFKGAYMFRPGMIQPLDGIQSKTKSYRILYSAIGPLLPLLKRLFPKYVTSTQEVGRAMLAVARNGYGKPLIEADEIGRIAAGHPG
ncbi:MAG: epimerase [Acidobacteriaceae bacterium]|nr:epimerase [Acidobacteriaceae bacterium]